MRDPVKRLKLYDAMKSDISSGVYLSGGFLPNEFELAEKYGYSRDTVRSTLAMLEDDKLVELLKGKGRRICPANVQKVKSPLTFLLPCADFISETTQFSNSSHTRQMLKGVSQVAFEHNCRVQTVPVSPTNFIHDIDWKQLEFVDKNSLVVISSFWYYDLFPLFKERRCRVALLDGQTFCSKVHAGYLKNWFVISVDRICAIETAVEHLFRQGCRRIALFHHHISEPEHPVMTGYRSGLRKSGLKFAAWHELPDEDMELEKVKSRLKDFYKKSGGFDSLIIDHRLRLHNLYQDLGLAENIKIVVSDDTGNNQWVTPPLTSLMFPYEEIGRIAARHLLSPDFSPGRQMISGRLIERESTSAFSEKALFVSV
ncbi:MAG: GntR family transcriptional regulator [Victivallaceae bacterium]|jgi:DNA-binding LacI/PurR family transcriptional regulator